MSLGVPKDATMRKDIYFDRRVSCRWMASLGFIEADCWMWDVCRQKRGNSQLAVTHKHTWPGYGSKDADTINNQWSQPCRPNIQWAY